MCGTRLISDNLPSYELVVCGWSKVEGRCLGWLCPCIKNSIN